MMYSFEWSIFSLSWILCLILIFALANWRCLLVYSLFLVGHLDFYSGVLFLRMRSYPGLVSLVGRLLTLKYSLVTWKMHLFVLVLSIFNTGTSFLPFVSLLKEGEKGRRRGRESKISEREKVKGIKKDERGEVWRVQVFVGGLFCHFWFSIFTAC